MTLREIADELNRHIIGQTMQKSCGGGVKKRGLPQLDDDLRQEVTPKTSDDWPNG